MQLPRPQVLCLLLHQRQLNINLSYNSNQSAVRMATEASKAGEPRIVAKDIAKMARKGKAKTRTRTKGNYPAEQ